MLVVGITATRSGLTAKQTDRLARLLAGEYGWDVAEVRHGDCVGGDATADALAAALGIRRVAHPPVNDALRAFCGADELRPAEEYHARNRAIVLASCPLVAMPATFREQKYGGTWATVRFARGLRRPVLVVRPDGSVAAERANHFWKTS